MTQNKNNEISEIVKICLLCFTFLLKAFQDYKKCFLFHLKSSFRSRDIKFYAIVFLPSHSFPIHRIR